MSQIIEILKGDYFVRLHITDKFLVVQASYDGDRIGNTIATFTDEFLAREYADFKFAQLSARGVK